jgi:hypothetical protein
VRAEIYKTIENCLIFFSWEYVKKFEIDMMLILMNSLEDTQSGIREDGLRRLEKIAENRERLSEKYEILND